MVSENTETGSEAERLECCTIPDNQFRKVRAFSILQYKEIVCSSLLGWKQSRINMVKTDDRYTSRDKAYKYSESAPLNEQCRYVRRQSKKKKKHALRDTIT